MSARALSQGCDHLFTNPKKALPQYVAIDIDSMYNICIVGSYEATVPFN